MKFVPMFALAASLAFAGIPGKAIADSPALLPVKVEKNIVYSTAGGDKLMLDLAAPTEGGPYPAVIMLHGGAWSMGSRADLSRRGKDDDGKPGPSVIEQVAARGYVAVSPSYRLAPKHKFPAQIEDARTAVRFLRANAKKYNLNPEKIAASGFSAGGHLALLLGAADKSSFENREYPDESSRVQCVVSFFGPTDLSLYAASEGIEDAYMVPLLGKACKTDPSVYKRASPIDYATKNFPPVLMIHGTADVVVPIIHSERLLKKLQEAGVSAELIVVKGEGHGWTGPIAAKTMRDAIKFLDEQLKGKK
ncbi:MAG TPA: alpha/beta hydrolase [Urbifossiella sp.]|jgi:acetyl esterase/lipase